MKTSEVEPAAPQHVAYSAAHQDEAPGTAGITGPSSLYRAAPWNACVRLARVLPQPALVTLAKGLAAVYRLACPARAKVVFNNLLPVFNGDRAAARSAARELFQNFAVKLADLWRYESGRPVDSLLESLT